MRLTELVRARLWQTAKQCWIVLNKKPRMPARGYQPSQPLESMGIARVCVMHAVANIRLKSPFAQDAQQDTETLGGLSTGCAMRVDVENGAQKSGLHSVLP